MVKKLASLLFILHILHANSSFQNISINKLNWSNSTKIKTSHQQKNFTYIELEGGATFNWGEFYGFLDIEGPKANIVIKPIVDIHINDNYYLHIQNYLFNSDDYYVNNLVIGVSTKYLLENFWITPFLGSHYKDDSYGSGINGYMAGWSLGYNTTIWNQNITLSQWHEMEFQRDKKHYSDANGSSSGTQGAIQLFWHIDTTYTNGIQYRYANNTLGYNSYQNAIIYTLKHSF